MTGWRPRPQPKSPGIQLLQPPAATQASHSSKVTSERPIAKGAEITASLGAASCGMRAVSCGGDPTSAEPAGTTTISGHSAQSLKVLGAASAGGRLSAWTVGASEATTSGFVGAGGTAAAGAGVGSTAG